VSQSDEKGEDLHVLGHVDVGEVRLQNGGQFSKLEPNIVFYTVAVVKEIQLRIKAGFAAGVVESRLQTPHHLTNPIEEQTLREVLEIEVGALDGNSHELLYPFAIAREEDVAHEVEDLLDGVFLQHQEVHG
jgi:hypothetical protein